MAETTVHGIEFQIKGSATAAANAIDKLTDNLKKLKKATAGGLGISDTVKDLRKLANALGKIDGGSAKNLKMIADGLKTISKTKLNSKDIDDLANSMQKLEPVIGVLNKFGEIGRVSVIGSVARQLNELKKTVDEMSEDTVKRIDEITRSLERLKGIDFRGFTKAARAAKEGVQTALAPIDKNTGLVPWKPVSDKEISDIFKAYGQQTATVEDKTMGKGGSAFGALTVSLKEAIKLLGQAAVRMIPFRAQIAGAANDAKKMVAEFAKDPIGNTMKGLGSLVAAPFKKGIKNVLEFSNGIKSVIGGFKRIAGYRLMRTIIKEITQGFQEGTKNLYLWSQSVGGQFAKNMDDAATSMLYFKNSIGAAWSPLMNILAPALRAVTDAAVDLLNIINQLLARLTGQSTWTRAKRVATEYGDAVAGAGQAAKEAIRYLAPFDELNVLPDDKDHGGSGGGGTSASEMFEEVASFNEGIADFADKVREAINSQNWVGLGVLLGDKINEIVDSINWAGYGQKVGGFINAWFTTKYWTLETINFTNIGSKIAEFLNNAMDQIDFNIIGRTITQKFTNTVDFLIGFLRDLNWKLVGESIRDFIVGAFNQVSQWADNIDWSQLGHDLYTKLGDLIEGLDFAGIAQSFFRFLGTAIGAATSFLGSFIGDAVRSIWSYFLSFAQDENGDGEIAGAEIFKAILKGIKNAVVGIFTWIKENVWDPLVSGFKRAAGINDGENGESEKLGKSIGTSILEGLARPFVNIWQWFLDHVINPLKEKIAGRPLTDFLFGDSEAESPTGNDGGGTFLGGGWSVDVEANVVSVTDSVPLPEKEFSGFTGKFQKADDEVPWESKVSAHWTAEIDNSQDGMSALDKVLADYAAEVTNATDHVPQHSKTTHGWNATVETQTDEVMPKDKILRDEEAVFGSVDASELTTAQRQIDNIVAKYSNVDDSKLTVGQKIINGIKAIFGSADGSKLGKSDRTIPTYADYRASIKANMTKPDSTLPVYADFRASIKSHMTVPDSTLPTTADFRASKKSNMTVPDSTIPTVADFRASKKNNMTVPDSTLSTVADFKARKDDLTQDQKTFGTTSRFQWIQDWLSGNDKTFGSTAKFLWALDWLGSWDKTFDSTAKFLWILDWLSGDDKTIGTTARYDSAWDNIPGYQKEINVTARMNGIAAGGGYYQYTMASGGVLRNGILSRIPQYAGGTSRAHGSLFVAGEAGPEIVGHIGGRTEVLNRSQLASTMYSAVSNAMAGLRFNISGMGAAVSADGEYDEEAMYRAMLRALNDSDVFPDEIDLDGDVVYRKMVQRNQLNTRMTGRNAMASA